MDILLAPAEPDVIDVTHRIVTSDGKTRWINARKQVFFAAGKRKIRPLTGVFAVVDISLRKQAEIKAEYLIGELNHRTKNLITVASSIVRQIERHSGSDDLGQKIVDRLGALARNQDAMLQTSSGVVDLVSVLEQEVQAISGTDSDRISMSGPKIKLTNETGQIIAMITHELVTNAAKYGALSTAVGNINLEWKVTEAQEFSFYWSELGGPNVEKPTRSGFGTQMLITYVQAALGGEASLEYHASGLKYVLTAPAERLLA